VADIRKLKDEANALAQKGKLDKALALFLEVSQNDPNDLLTQLQCGHLLRKLQKNDEAFAFYLKVAKTYASMQLPLKAVAACKLAIEVRPDAKEAQTLLTSLVGRHTSEAVAKPIAAAAPIDIGAGDINVDATAKNQLATEAGIIAPSSIPLFADLPAEVFAKVLTDTRSLKVSAGDVILREGDDSHAMFIITHGAVRISKRSGDQDIVLARLSDGAFFGEIALLTDSPRTATVTAEQETLLLQVERPTIEYIVSQYPAVRDTLLRFYRSRLIGQLIAISPALGSLGVKQRIDLIQKFVYREAESGRHVLTQGQPGDGLYLLVAGRVKVIRHVDDKSHDVATLKPGDIFGEMSLINNEPVSADVIAIGKCIVLRLPRAQFLDLASSYPQLLADLASLSSQRSHALLELEATLDIGGAKLQI
jgi:cAMP-dependent protein kinase regulator